MAPNMSSVIVLKLIGEAPVMTLGDTVFESLNIRVQQVRILSNSDGGKKGNQWQW